MTLPPPFVQFALPLGLWDTPGHWVEPASVKPQHSGSDSPQLKMTLLNICQYAPPLQRLEMLEKFPSTLTLTSPRKEPVASLCTYPSLSLESKRKRRAKSPWEKKQHSHGDVFCFADSFQLIGALAACATWQKQSRKYLRKKSDYCCALELHGRLLIMGYNQSRDTQGAESWDSLRWEPGRPLSWETFEFVHTYNKVCW